MHARRVFFTTAVSGLVAAILPFVFFSDDPQKAMVSTVVIVLGTMISYHRWASKMMLKRPEALSIADSCYYLGFLFTLGILCISFLFASKRPTIDIKEITTQFALGLIATGYGLIARIHLSSFNDIESLDDVMVQQERLASKVLEMVRKVELGTTQLNSLFAYQAEHLNESVKHGRTVLTSEAATISNTAAEFSNRIAALSKSFIPDVEAAALKKAVGTFAKTMEEGEAEAKKWAVALAAGAKDYGNQTSNLNAGLLTLRMSAESLSGSLGTCFKGVGDLSKQLAQLSSSTGTVSGEMQTSSIIQMRESTSKLAKSAQDLSSAIDTIRGGLGKLLEASGELETAQRNSSSKIQEVADRFASGGLASAAQELSQTMMATGNGLTAVADAAQSLGEAQKVASNKITEAANRFGATGS